MSPVLPPMSGSRARMASTTQSHRGLPTERGAPCSAARRWLWSWSPWRYTRFTVTWPNRPLGFSVSTVMTMISATRQLLAVADDVEAGGLLEQVAEIGDQVLQHADDEAAGHGAARARDAADQRAGEAVEQDARHHVGLEVDGGRDQCCRPPRRWPRPGPSPAPASSRRGCRPAAPRSGSAPPRAWRAPAA